MKLSNKTYDVLKWLCLIALPAISVFYTALDGIFSLGAREQVTTLLAAAETFLGTLIGVSQKGGECA